TQATWETMTPRVRVGQLFLLGIPATAADGLSSVIDRLAPGGVFLVGRSTAGVVATAATTGAIHRRGTSASGGGAMFVATDRAYGTDPQVVSKHVLAFARGMREAGVVSTVKHFPGLGRVRDNIDFSSGVVDEQTTAADPYLLPFSRASGAGTPWMMVSSAIYSRIDAQQPASFSAAIITTLLREKIGYRGLIVSDDLGRAKQVATVPPGQRAVRFL